MMLSVVPLMIRAITKDLVSSKIRKKTERISLGSIRPLYVYTYKVPENSKGSCRSGLCSSSFLFFAFRLEALTEASFAFVYASAGGTESAASIRGSLASNGGLTIQPSIISSSSVIELRLPIWTYRVVLFHT